jgi:PadR family transcriptional regulator, regulatory protein PadR
MKPPLRLSPQTLQVLDAFLVSPRDWKYGYDISRNTGLKSGTLYPILMRMADRKLLETSWETTEPGRPPRHMYRFTPDGLRFAREHRVPRAAARVPNTAFMWAICAVRTAKEESAGAGNAVRVAIGSFTDAFAVFTRVIETFTGAND